MPKQLTNDEKDDVLADVLRENAIEGAKAMRAAMVYQGDNRAIIRSGEFGKAFVQTYTRFYGSRTNNARLQFDREKLLTHKAIPDGR